MKLPGTDSAPSGGPPLTLDLAGLFTNFAQLFTSGPDCSAFLPFTGHYDQILPVPLPPALHRECEYAIPVARTADALQAIERIMDEEDLSLTLPIEVRFAPPRRLVVEPRQWHRCLLH